MTGTLQDLRYATRGLRKSPGFMVVAALTLALGIGANVAVFTVMNAILLNPSGIPHPESVIALRAKYSLADLANINISAPDFGDAVTGKDVVTSAAVLQAANFNYSGSGTTPERLVGANVSWQWFDVFWASPYLGRVFRPEEDQPNANHEAVLSYHTWKQRFGGDPAIVGKSLLLNQESYQVVGVMRPDFDWPNGTELWTPIALPSSQYFDRKFRFNESLFGVARLRPGVSLEQANAFLRLRTAQEIAAEGPTGYAQSGGWGMFAMGLVEFVAGNLRKPLAILLAAVATVLLIACANIAGLLLARATGRQHEVSIQIALGAGNGRLIRQALLESLVLAVVGVLLGLAARSLRNSAITSVGACNFGRQSYRAHGRTGVAVCFGHRCSLRAAVRDGAGVAHHAQPLVSDSSGRWPLRYFRESAATAALSSGDWRDRPGDVAVGGRGIVAPQPGTGGTPGRGFRAPWAYDRSVFAPSPVTKPMSNRQLS